MPRACAAHDAACYADFMPHDIHIHRSEERDAYAMLTCRRFDATYYFEL